MATSIIKNALISTIEKTSTTTSITVSANASASYTYDVSDLVSGYKGWAILYTNTQSANVLAANYWVASTTSVTAYYRNITNTSQTTTAQLTILRWK